MLQCNGDVYETCQMSWISCRISKDAAEGRVPAFPSPVKIRDNLALGIYLVLIPGNLSVKSVGILLE